MHRFPNPGSDIKNSIESLRFLMDNIEDTEFFDLLDMKELLVLNGFVSSSGSTGQQALQRSHNVDRSRDQTYNQCKMYAEIYRGLGWISSVDKALDYQISLFGRHVLNSKVKAQKIFEHSLLGIENPNGILKIDRNYRLRPFLAILKCARRLNGYISRDEMIYGPLFLRDDTDDMEVEAVCLEILNLREQKGELKKRLLKKYDERKKETGRGFSKTTSENYTRFPIAAIQWVNWFTKKKNSLYLTDYGHNALRVAESKVDLRFDDVQDDDTLTNVAKFAYYEFMIEFGYDLGSNSDEYQQAKANVPFEIAKNGTLFSPFSTISNEKLADIFNFTIPTIKRKTNIELDDEQSTENYTGIVNPFRLVESRANPNNEYSNRLVALLSEHSDVKVAQIIKDEVRWYRKEEFYPWISDVFSVLGIDCNIPQHGNNSVRWDAILLNNDKTDTVPIELKSPTEELHISTKAIRQALENKMVLQSRKALANHAESSTLAIGFELPNKRSEVESLITAFYKTFGFNIAVICTEHLIKLSIKCVQEGKQLKFDEFTSLRGIIHE